MNKHQKSMLQAEAQSLASEEAQRIAEDYAVRFIQQLGADLSGVRGQTYMMPPEKFSDAFTVVRSIVLEAAFERLFEEKHGTLIREAKREAAAERRERKWKAEAEAEAEEMRLLEKQLEQEQEDASGLGRAWGDLTMS